MESKGMGSRRANGVGWRNDNSAELRRAHSRRRALAALDGRPRLPGRGWLSFGAASIVVLAIAVAAVISVDSRSDEALATGPTACASVPAGYSCTPLLNKGTGATIGELFYQRNGTTLTMFPHVFSSPSGGPTDEKLCLDDDGSPWVSGASCLGNSAGTKITSCADLPSPTSGEEPSGKYEVFISGSDPGEPLHWTNQTIGSLTLPRFDVCVSTYHKFSFHFNWGGSSIEAFFKSYYTTPTPTPPPTPTPHPPP
ncbi:MAG: hypothetical protein WD379_10190, partial [Dehalococcoidia bacterium]